MADERRASHVIEFCHCANALQLRQTSAVDFVCNETMLEGYVPKLNTIHVALHPMATIMSDASYHEKDRERGRPRGEERDVNFVQNPI